MTYRDDSDGYEVGLCVLEIKRLQTIRRRLLVKLLRRRATLLTDRYQRFMIKGVPSYSSVMVSMSGRVDWYLKTADRIEAMR